MSNNNLMAWIVTAIVLCASLATIVTLNTNDSEGSFFACEKEADMLTKEVIYDAMGAGGIEIICNYSEPRHG